MVLYLGMAVVLYIMALYCSAKEIKTNIGAVGIGKASIFLFITTTIILGGIRWETGTDWNSYYNYFNKNTTWKQFSGTFEISYSFLNFMIKRCFGSYTVFLFIISFFVIILRYNTIKKIALYPVISYFIFFCDNIGGMFPVRQTLAISIALTSIYFIHNKNKSAFLVITFIAVSFHLSLILWFLSYPLYHIKIRSSMIVLLFITATIFGMFGSGIFIWITKATLQVFGISGTIASVLQGYILGNYSDGSFSILRMLLSMVKRMFFVFLFLLLRRKLVNNYTYAAGLINLYLLSNIIYSLFGFNEAFIPMTRMVTPFLFIEVLLIPSMLKLFKNNYTRYFLLFLFLLYGLMKLTSSLNTYPDAFMPYRSILG
jgi:hypothetical protein